MGQQPSPKRIAGMMMADMEVEHAALMKTNRMLAAALIMAINSLAEQVKKPVVLTLTPEGQELVQTEWVLDIAMSKDEETFQFQTKAVDKSKGREDLSLIVPPGTPLN